MLSRTTYFIREHVGLLKLADAYDILDPETGQRIGLAEEEPGWLIHLLRLALNKRALPTSVYVYEIREGHEEAECLFSIHRGFTLLRSKIAIRDGDGHEIGWFEQAFVSLGGAFTVFDGSGHEVGTVKGDWKGSNFRFVDDMENELGEVTKEWAGLGKELFTSADNYIVSLNRQPSAHDAMLLLAAALTVDIMFYEETAPQE